MSGARGDSVTMGEMARAEREAAGRAAADLLGVRLSAVFRAAQRGRTARRQWESVLTVGEREKNIRKQRPL